MVEQELVPHSVELVGGHARRNPPADLCECLRGDPACDAHGIDDLR